MTTHVSTVISGNGIVRRDLDDFGGPVTKPGTPASRCTACRNPQHANIEVDVLPPQTEQLTTAQA